MQHLVTNTRNAHIHTHAHTHTHTDTNTHTRTQTNTHTHTHTHTQTHTNTHTHTHTHAHTHKHTHTCFHTRLGLPLSDALVPITYYVDPTVPERWRAYIREGVEKVKCGMEPKNTDVAPRVE